MRAYAYQSPPGGLREARQLFETQYFENLLKVHRWKISEVAEVAGIDESHCYRKLRFLGLLGEAEKRK